MALGYPSPLHIRSPSEFIVYILKGCPFVYFAKANHYCTNPVFPKSYPPGGEMARTNTQQNPQFCLPLPGNESVIPEKNNLVFSGILLPWTWLTVYPSCSVLSGIEEWRLNEIYRITLYGSANSQLCRQRGRGRSRI